ncbi:hypothetical protein FO519_004441 [Halicephalobus sp. NKZ332]|nr:hypothetical protein FO519_004441 [Halicephalobus sp. NKZ332]
MVLLLTAPREFPLNQEFLCLSRNLSTVTTSKTKLRLAHDINMYCKWTTVILSCSTVAHPETFSLAIPGFTNEAEILFDSPVRKKLPTVACLPPTFLEERWQTLVVSIELYKFFGINFQVHYIQSGLKQIFDILKKYEEKEILEIREFPFLKLDQEYMDFLGYDPVNELDGRNQPVSYTDCLMRYREAADFIFIIDVDDIMIPFRNSDYISELNLLLNEYPTASAFVFPRFRAEAITVTSFHKFSLEKTLQSVRISNEGEVGKSVLIPGKAETAWLHWPGIGNESSREIPKEKSLFLHLRNWSGSAASPNSNSKKTCKTCGNQLGFIFNSGSKCRKCQLLVCDGCRCYVDSEKKNWLCNICFQERELLAASNEWFYQDSDGDNNISEVLLLQMRRATLHRLAESSNNMEVSKRPLNYNPRRNMSLPPIASENLLQVPSDRTTEHPMRALHRFIQDNVERNAVRDSIEEMDAEAENDTYSLSESSNKYLEVKTRYPFPSRPRSPTR